MLFGNVNFDQVLDGYVHSDVVPLLRRVALKNLGELATKINY